MPPKKQDLGATVVRGKKRSLRFIGGILAILIGGIIPVRAQTTYTWKASPTNANWNTASNWSGGVTPTSSTNSALVFATSSQTSLTDNIANGSTFRSITFNSGASTYTIGGNSFTLNGTANSIVNNSTATQTINNAITLGMAQTWNAAAGGLVMGGGVTNGGFLLTLTGSHAFSMAAISGSGGLTINNSGATVSLTAASNYTGATTISAGTLQQGAANRLASGSAYTLANTANTNLDLNGFAATVASLSGGGATGGNVTLGANATLTVNGSANTAYAGVISGTGTSGLTYSGSGTLTLSGANTYAGATTLSSGTLVATTNAAALGAGTLVLNGGNLVLSDNSGLNFGRNTTIGGNTTITSDRTSSGNGTTQTLGTLSIGTNTLTTTAGSNVTSGTAGITFGATTLSAANTVFAPGAGSLLTLASLTGTNRNFSVNGAGDMTITGAITDGTGTLTKSGNGTLTLSGNSSSYSGTITLNAGTLNATTSANALGTGTLALNGGNLELANDTGLNFGRNTTIGGNVSITSDVLTNGTAGVTHTLGTLSIGANTLSTAAGSSVGSGTAGISFGATTISASGATFAAGTGSLLTLASVTGSNRNFVVSGSGDMEISGAVTIGTGTLTKSGSGTLDLSSASSTYTGATTISGGTIAVSKMADGGSNSSLGAATATNTNLILNGGTLQYTGSGDSSNRLFSVGSSGGTLDASGTGTLNLTGTGTLGGNGQTTARTLTLTGTGTGSLAAQVTNFTGATSLTKSGSGSWTISGNNTYTGVTTIAGGTLQFAKQLSLYNNVTGNWTATNLVVNSGAIAAFNVGGTGEFTSANIDTLKALGTGSGGFMNGSAIGFDTTNASGSNFTYNSVISNTNSGANAIGITKLGSGTLTLGGNNTYTGATTVSAGTLTVNSGAAIGGATSSLVVNGGTLNLNNSAQTVATLNGTGGTINLGAGHTLTVNGAGTSTWTGNMVLNGNATITTGTNLVTVGNGTLFNSTITLGSNTLTLNTVGSPLNTPDYLPGSYNLDPANILINSGISGTGGLIKTGSGTAMLLPNSASNPNSFTGDTLITGGTLIVDAPNNRAGLSSGNIIVGNSSSPGSADTVVLQMGQLASPPSSNNILGVWNNTTDSSATNLTIYADGVLKMNDASNGFKSVSLTGGHITQNTVSSSALLTLGDGGTTTNVLTTSASNQTAVIENGRVGLATYGNSNITVAAGSTSSGIDLRIDSQVQQGLLYTSYTDTNTSLTKLGNGTLSLTGANTYHGVTDVSAGILKVQNNVALGAVSSSLGSLDNGTIVRSGAQLQFDKGTGSDLSIGLETLTLNGSGIGTNLDGALRNYAGNNTYSGYIYLGSDSRINADSGTTLTIQASNLGASIINGSTAGKNLTVGGSGNTTVNGAISGNVTNIVKDGSGTLTLAGYNGYAGATNATQGAIKVIHNNGLSGTGVTVTSGAELQFAQTALNADINVIGVGATINGYGNGGVNNGSNGAIENLTGNNTYQGAIVLGSASSIKANSGTSLTLSGGIDTSSPSHNALTVYGNITENGAIKSGNVTVSSGNITSTGSGGTLQIGNKTSAVSGNLTMGNGVTSALDGITLALGNLTVTGTNTLVQAGPLSSTTASNVLTINSSDKVQSYYAGSTTTTFTGQMAGAGTFQKDGAGILVFDTSFDAQAAGLTLIISGGELDLKSGAQIKVGTLHFTGNTILDFDSSSTTLLQATNVIIDPGVSITVNNWASETDFWMATGSFYQSGTNINAVHNATGTAPESQITFANWSNLNTTWIATPYPGYTNNEIRPIPEPATYGALFLSSCFAFLGWRRYSRRDRAGIK